MNEKGQVQHTTAQWYIGLDRAIELADYAIGRFDDRINEFLVKCAGKPYLDDLLTAIEIARKTLNDLILLWEDESLGPLNEEGIPLALTGVGAKDRYKAYIDQWVEQLAIDIERRFASGGEEPIQLLPQFGRLGMAEKTENWPEGVAKEIPGVEGESEIRATASFRRRAEEIMEQYPFVIGALKETFYQQAERIAERYGVEKGLELLENQLRSIRYAGERKGA